jgi:predicted dehydrogenase
MKILFFGLGSIGQRHARLLKELGGHDLHAFRSRRDGKKNELGIPEIFDWVEVDRLRPEVAFITNPTSLHIPTALACAERGIPLFLEKPIGSSLDGLDKLLNLAEKNRLATYVAYVLRFHPQVKRLKEEISGLKVRRARLVSRSYLPDWRAGQNHLNSYSARRELGGGALLDVSHEFDLARFLFGPVAEITGRLERRSDVTVDAEDYVEATARSGSVNVEIVIDIASQKPERTITVETDRGTVTADLMQESDRDTPYRNQLRFFFDNMNNPKMMNNIPEATPLFRQLIAFREKNFS